MWIAVPDEQLVITGDLVTAQAPLFDTGCEEGWAAALNAIAAAQWTSADPRPWPADGPRQFRPLAHCLHDLCRLRAFRREGRGLRAGWVTDAVGFYTEEEATAVGQLALYYVTDVLRALPRRGWIIAASGG